MSDTHDEDFEAMLEESLAAHPITRRLRLGEKVRGTVISVTDDYVLVDLGGKTEGVIDKGDLVDDEGRLTVAEGDEVEAHVSHVGDEIRLSRHVRPGAGAEEALQEAYEGGLPVEGRVTGVNKGGLEVLVAGKRAFCPVSQIQLGFCEDPSVFVDEKLDFRITRMEDRNIVLSRRALLEEERERKAAETWERLREGEVLEGAVTRVAAFGVFVDVGGVDGLVHVSELSHERVEDPGSVLGVGQKVTVQVVSVDRDQGRVGLSLKALQADPWETAFERFPPGSEHEGTVTRLAPFGAFVALGGGLEGLVHVSEIADRRIGHPKEVLEEGQAVQVRVLEVDPERQRIGLSMREAREAPGELPAVGVTVAAVVERAEPYGLLVRFGGHRGLVPTGELPDKGGASAKSLKQAYPEGTELTARVIEVDEAKGRVRLSVTAAAEAADRAQWEQFQGQAKSSGFGSSLGDLLKKKLEGK